MIPRITRGSSAYGALAYDHGPGRDPRSEHKNAHKVAGNVPGNDWRIRARHIDKHMRTAAPNAAKPLHRTALRVAPEDRALADKEWRQIAERYIQRMGFEKCPWEATRHAGDHIHITVSRVQWDGELVNPKFDFARAQKTAREIERAHQLVDASKRYDLDRPQVSRAEREKAERKSRETGTVQRTEREELRDRLRAAERASDGTTESYEHELSAHGVVFAANRSKSTGRVSGYRYGLTGHTDTARDQVWFKGSQLGKEFAWQRSAERLTERQHDIARQGERQNHRVEAKSEQKTVEAGQGDSSKRPVSQQTPEPQSPQTEQHTEQEQQRAAARERAQQRLQTSEREDQAPHRSRSSGEQEKAGAPQTEQEQQRAAARERAKERLTSHREHQMGDQTHQRDRQQPQPESPHRQPVERERQASEQQAPDATTEKRPANRHQSQPEREAQSTAERAASSETQHEEHNKGRKTQVTQPNQQEHQRKSEQSPEQSAQEAEAEKKSPQNQQERDRAAARERAQQRLRETEQKREQQRDNERGRGR